MPNRTNSRVLESATDYAVHTARLFMFSENTQEVQLAPATLYLDLIGWSRDNFGKDGFDHVNGRRHLGFYELELIGKALVEYAACPDAISGFVALATYEKYAI